MTRECEQLLQQLGAPVLSFELMAHVQQCPSCRAARTAHQAMTPRTGPRPSAMPAKKADATRLAALRALAEQPRARPWWWLALVLVGANLLAAAVGLLTLSHPARAMDLTPLRVLVLVLWGVVMVGGAVAAIAPGARRWRLAVLVLAALALAVRLAGDAGLDGGLTFLAAGRPCLLTELGLGMAPAAAALWVLTRSAFEPVRALLVGVAAGAAGLLALDLHCVNGGAAHLVLFHGLPCFALGLAVLAARLKTPSHSFAP